MLLPQSVIGVFAESLKRLGGRFKKNGQHQLFFTGEAIMKDQPTACDDR
jgi:hypothetical protein